MEQELRPEPWEKVESLLETGSPEELREFLLSLPPGETARALSRLPEREQARVFVRLGPIDAAELLDDLSHRQAADIIEDLPATHAAAIVDEMASDQQVDILGHLDDTTAQAILEEMTPEDASGARVLLQYPPDTAGGLMIREFVAYPETMRVTDVLDDLREHSEAYSDYDVQYAYIVSAGGELVGVLPLRDLLLSPGAQSVTRLMIQAPLRVTVETPLPKLIEFFNEHAFFGVPVVDERGRLMGVVRRSAVESAAELRATRDFLKLSGLFGEEELRSMPVATRSSRRLSWLSLNIVLNLISASVIAFYQDTLKAAIALAVFLPIISDMSGCSGNQAVAVSIRELTLGLIKPYEFRRIFLKEIAVGAVNGLFLGLLLGSVAWAWKGNPWLGLVVGAALLLNTIVSVILGGVVPLFLRSRNLDPALASGPILTTVTDMVGFFLVLSFATLTLSRISG